MHCSRSLASDPPSQLHVLRHDRDTLGVDGAQIGVLKETDQISFCRFLKGLKSRPLEPADISYVSLHAYHSLHMKGCILRCKVHLGILSVASEERHYFTTPDP